jgi:hypothetical protein
MTNLDENIKSLRRQIAIVQDKIRRKEIVDEEGDHYLNLIMDLHSELSDLEYEKAHKEWSKVKYGKSTKHNKKND